MSKDRLIRGALWTSVPYNLGAALLLAFPESALGQWAGLPGSAPLLYRFLLAMFVALFGAAYAWLARRDVIDRPLVAVATLGKAFTFTIVLLLWLGGAVSIRSVGTAIGDAVLAAIFWRWLRA